MAPSDPTGRLTDLRTALSDPRLGPPPDPGAALRLAVALGYCRLYGLDPGGLDGALPAGVARAAVERLGDVLRAAAARAGRLGIDWDDTADPAEADDLVFGLLSTRMDAWAALEAVHEAADALSAEGDPDAAAVVAALDAAAGPLDAFDVALERHLDILAAAVGTPLFGEWVSCLASEHRDPLPWWLGDRVRGVAVHLGGPAATLRLPPGPLVPPVVAAAEITAADRPVVLPGATWAWLRPDGRARAVLRVPSPLTPAELAKERVLNVRGPDGRPAYAGEPVRVGPVRLTLDARGQARVRLADLGGGPVRVWVSEPEQEWAFDPGADHAANHS